MIAFANEENVKSHILKKKPRKGGQKFVISENDILKTWNSLADMLGERERLNWGRMVSFRKDYKVESVGWLLDRLICVMMMRKK